MYRTSSAGYLQRRANPRRFRFQGTTIIACLGALGSGDGEPTMRPRTRTGDSPPRRPWLTANVGGSPSPHQDRSPKPGYDPAMEQRVSLITLGVTDLKRARAFYERLGGRGQEVEETVFFQVGGIALVLWGRDKLALDAGINDEPGGGFSGVGLAHNVRSWAGFGAVSPPAGRAGTAGAVAAG